MVGTGGEAISTTRRCELLGVSRSSLYYRRRRDGDAAAFEAELLSRIDALYTERPHLGRYGMRSALAQMYGIEVNHKRVRRLMKTLGLEAVYPRPRRNTSQGRHDHRKYPYLLRNMEITRPDQVWCADITYIRLYRGFAYLVVVMDWHSRCVLGWALSNTLDSGFCVEALKQALASGRRPEIFNTDQGSQFTSEAFTSVLTAEGIAISMDGVGRAFDNIMVERLWRTVKYEDVYLRDYQTPGEARLGLEKYLMYYNRDRRHRSLGDRTPASVYGLEGAESRSRIVEVSAEAQGVLDGVAGEGLAGESKGDRIETGVGRSDAAIAAAAPVALRAPSTAAAKKKPMRTAPPYSR
jgi:putative transposase